MSTIFLLGKDAAGYNTFSLPNADLKYSGELLKDIAQSVVLPTRYKKYRVVFAYEPGAEVWVAINATAAIPSGAIATTSSEMNPVARDLDSGDTISFIASDDTSNIGIVIYAIQ